MIQQKLQNIEELKIIKTTETSETVIMFSLNDFLLNMLSDQIKVLMKFDSAY